MLLQIMEEGRLTDSFGRHVDFRNVILIMTSNLGSQQMKAGTKLGFDRMATSSKVSDEERFKRMRADVMIEVERYFRPEFLNRVDELVVFNPLTSADLAKIVHLQLAEVQKRLTEKGVKLDLDQAAIDFLIAKGTSEDYGARPLRSGIVTDRPMRVRVGPDPEKLVFDQPEPAREPVQAAAGPES
jgi:ATP-dependent Clp protease ATP-binding subunit ClpC